MPYSSLDPEKISQTTEKLRTRIGERVPEAGLYKVACELETIGQESRETSSSLEAPIYWLRALIVIVTFAGALVFAFIGTLLSFDRISTSGFDFVQGVEASINTLVLAGIGWITLLKSEERIKRRIALAGLHKLRSIIHVIDMHQLTKDPATLSLTHQPTRSSPERTLSPRDLARYLDYCSELLALTGKFAALYAQSLPDTEIVDAVNDVEMLGSNLSRKIWQKIMMIDADRHQPAVSRKRKG